MKRPKNELAADRRPLFPEVIAFGAPRGLRARLQAFASHEGTSVSALVRRAIERDLMLRGELTEKV